MERKVIVIADLPYGDSGKGTTVDFLTRLTGAHTVVRHNGGAQAGHNVTTPNGKHHTFAQFGSGTLVSNTKTFLSQYMMVHPPAMINEAEHLKNLGIANIYERVSIDRKALVISPFQQATNRLKEIHKGANRHGSCGMGIGETMSDFLTYPDLVLHAGDLEDKLTTKRKLTWMRDHKWQQIVEMLPNLSKVPEAQKEIQLFLNTQYIEDFTDLYWNFSNIVNVVDEKYFNTLLQQPGTIIFESAQGVLLDQLYGFYPYNSWSNLTNENADEMLSDYDGDITKLGIIRGYLTRHGAGPFVTEDAELSKTIPDVYNRYSTWQQDFRVGYLDLLALKYAHKAVGNLDGLVVTNLDCMKKVSSWKVCDSYQYKGKDIDTLHNTFEHQGKKVTSITLPSCDQAKNLTLISQRSNILMECEPNYDKIFSGNDAEEYAHWVSDLLNIPLAITSSGPTANEKVAHSFLEKRLREGVLVR